MTLVTPLGPAAKLSDVTVLTGATADWACATAGAGVGSGAGALTLDPDLSSTGTSLSLTPEAQADSNTARPKDKKNLFTTHSSDSRF
jgi:hypothetical protein